MGIRQKGGDPKKDLGRQVSSSSFITAFVQVFFLSFRTTALRFPPWSCIPSAVTEEKSEALWQGRNNQTTLTKNLSLFNDKGNLVLIFCSCPFFYLFLLLFTRITPHFHFLDFIYSHLFFFGLPRFSYLFLTICFSSSSLFLPFLRNTKPKKLNGDGCTMRYEYNQIYIAISLINQRLSLLCSSCFTLTSLNEDYIYKAE